MTTPTAAKRSEGGRPRATSRAELQRAAFALFADAGFDDTSIDDIAAAAGIARRTFFRYFASKADLVWGDFPSLVSAMRASLRACPETTSMMQALSDAVVEFNVVHPEDENAHRERMTLILEVPALRADSTLRFDVWRAEVAEFAAARLGLAPHDLPPVVIGYSALGASLAAYEQWLTAPGSDLGELLRAAFSVLTADWPNG